MSDRIIPAPDIGDERLAELIGWTGKAGMPDVHAMLLDLQLRRSADRDAEFVALRKALWVRLEQCQKQAERIREPESGLPDVQGQATAATMLLDGLTGRKSSNVFEAARNAESVIACLPGRPVVHEPSKRGAELHESAADLAMPRRKEWDAEAHDRGDTSESDGYETADYVDGWNEALDAVVSSGVYRTGEIIRAGIIALLDSDAPAGELRCALAELVGRKCSTGDTK